MRIVATVLISFLAVSCAGPKGRSFVITGANGINNRGEAERVLKVEPQGIYFYDRNARRSFAFSFDPSYKPSVGVGYSSRQIANSQLPAGMQNFIKCTSSKDTCKGQSAEDCRFDFQVKRSAGQDLFPVLSDILRKGQYPISVFEIAPRKDTAFVTVRYFEECKDIESDMHEVVTKAGLSMG